MYKETVSIPALTLAPYVANDCVGALLTFPVHSPAIPPRKDCRLLRLTIIDAAVQDEEYYLHLFNASPLAAARTDADAYAPIAADLAMKMTTLHIEAADYHDSAGDSIAIYELDHALVLVDGNIYGVLECIATPDYVAVDDLTLKLIVEI